MRDLNEEINFDANERMPFDGRHKAHCFREKLITHKATFVAVYVKSLALNVLIRSFASSSLGDC